MRHPDGARRRRGGGLTLDGGLVLAAILVHRCYLGDGGVKANVRRDPRGDGNRRSKGSGAYLSPVLPQIAGLLGRGQTSASRNTFQPVSTGTEMNHFRGGSPPTTGTSAPFQPGVAL